MPVSMARIAEFAAAINGDVCGEPRRRMRSTGSVTGFAGDPVKFPGGLTCICPAARKIARRMAGPAVQTRLSFDKITRPLSCGQVPSRRLTRYDQAVRSHKKGVRACSTKNESNGIPVGAGWWGTYRVFHQRRSYILRWLTAHNALELFSMPGADVVGVDTLVTGLAGSRSRVRAGLFGGARVDRAVA